ncbi:hypothetical protein [Aeribacillus pallidus]|uniref:hypothetical protein n=1 Tax=Aeribacillus pallidus TaxID=33936 RepID=UPI000E3464DC|nr:hypothetical protein [Aeribacillus pallidus]
MGYFIGYHGTSSVFAEKILRTNFIVDHTKVGWLGTGIYLFEENQELARSWANYKYSNSKKGVIRCEIEIAEEEVFDVVDPLGEHNKFFHAVRKQLIEQEIKKRNLQLRAKNRKDFDGKTYNFICKAKGFKLVRAATYTYQDYDRIFGWNSRVPNGVELCVKDINCIKNKQLV